MSLAPGTRLGAYEITAQIGAGGMGEVYRANDGSLKRQVAIKVLPEAVATDPQRVSRFRREAELLAALNHPNIAHLYGLEDIDGITALVMELVEGPTLADRIANGPIPVEEALSIAKQIAEALEAAHERGIVHRDLKPANVKVTDAGTVKVLDFGLAKAMEPASASGDIANSPTMTSPAMTRVGTVLGTAAYMSPEQARGNAVDKRTDIWAFGCVFYEMLTGGPAFPGDTVADSVAKIIERSPDFEALPGSMPPSVRRLVRRCLERDPRERLRDIGDARIEIGQALAAPLADAAREAFDSAVTGVGSSGNPVREEERRRQKQIEGCRLAGMIVTASGLGAGALLYGLVPHSGLYLVAAVPTALGAALLLYGFVVAPRSAVTGVGASRDPVREEERRRLKQVEGFKLAGLIVTASGLGAGALLYGLVPDSGVYLVAAVPTAVGCALLLYGFVVAPRSAAGGK
jgi:Protein kinase domain